MKYVWLLFLAGCSAAPYTSPPQINQVHLRMIWSSPAQITVRCGVGIVSCATLGSAALPYAAIWAEKPWGFNDHSKVCALGHELLHTLGATHP